MTQLEDLQRIASEETERRQGCRHRLCVCIAAGCVSSHSDQVQASLTNEVKRRGLEGQVEVRPVGCMGLCSAGPLVQEETSGVLYQHVRQEDAAEILDSLDAKPVERLRCDSGQPFFRRQQKIVLENSGVINPHRIEDYIAAGGYEALVQALTSMKPMEVVEEVIRSGLRGRGGGGYPTGLKWSTVAKAGGDKKYVVCNADEGDPGAFMDRAVLESDPHRVLEGMAIAGYATGADMGYVYIRAEYPLAIAHLRTAIRQAKKMDLLGNSICGTRFNFDVELRLGAGAFVCGEETALIASIEGGRGQPRPRPPYPAQSGLWGKSTLINNVETFANIAPIIRRGGDWFASIGTAKSKGTKVFALAGKIRNTGLIEVPMGVTLREIVFDIGGGIPGGHRFKAVQTGGPSGGCIPEQHLDMPVDYDSLREIGSIMGSGGMIVIDETSSMVDVAKYFMEFCMSESCGKCIPCRVGTHHMHGLLEKILEGHASAADVAQLEALCDMVMHTSLCGLGITAPNPVLSTLRHFRGEYEGLLQPAGGNGHASPSPAGGA
ncbi:MAG: SLBB domain-containing protein [Candidatus Sumerlaeia bacterium]|nr:SLBB domain-containing protein [Candidatus Sumerlaeia bacterium]